MLLRAGVWGTLAGTESEAVRIALVALKSQLSTWYSSPDGRGTTQVSKLTLKMIGTHANQALKLKAMETYGFLLFLSDAVQKQLPRLGPKGPLYLEAGLCLVRYVDLVKSAPVNVPEAVRQVAAESSGLDIEQTFMFSRLGDKDSHFANNWFCKSGAMGGVIT
jgi:hypothetical protein